MSFRPAPRRVARMLELTAGALELAARAIEGDRYAAHALPERVAELTAAASDPEAALARATTGANSPLARSSALHLAKRG